MITNPNKQEIPTVRQAHIQYGLDYKDMSPLGQQLFDIAQEIEFSDEPDFDENTVEKELLDRRGGQMNRNGGER